MNKFRKGSFVIKTGNLHRCLAALFLLGVFFSPGNSQIEECEAYIPDISEGNTDCIDVTQPGMTTSQFILPPNIDRIETDGLKICGPGVTVEPNPLTVIFIVDMSTSMFGADCNGCPHDPNFDAPKAVTQAIQDIRDNVPNSLVGFFGFSGGVCDGTGNNGGDGAGQKFIDKASTVVNPINVSVPANVETLLAQTDYTEDNHHFSCGTDGGGTLYYSPFQKALEMFEEVRPTAPTNKEIIIFVTDGEPNDEDDLASFKTMVTGVVDGTSLDFFPETHAIFINGQNNDLEDLADASGGSLISVDNAEAISDSLSDIVASIKFSFNYQTVVSFSIADWNHHEIAFMDTTGAGAANDGEIRLGVDRAIPLDQGDITVTVTIDPGGVEYQHQFTFSFTGEEITQNGIYENPEGTPFQTICGQRTAIDYTNFASGNGFIFSIEGQKSLIQAKAARVKQLNIYNTAGHLVHSSKAGSGHFEWDARGFNKGVYLVEMAGPHSKEYGKVMVW